MSKPKLFIGSSIEGLKVAYALQENLRYSAETTVWDQDVFNLSESSLESLVTALEANDFGVFIFSPDDYIKIRGKKDLAARDNVIFELGLFIGKLTRKRSFIVIPDEPAFHLPTDLIGFTPAKYESTRSDGNIQAATSSAANKIREAIFKLGPLKRENELPEITSSNSKDGEDKKLEWIDHLFQKDYKNALEKLKRKLRYTKELDEKINLKGWVCYTEYQKDASKGNDEYQKLISENSSNNLAYIAYANNFIWNNNFKKALEIIESGIKNCSRIIILTTLKARCFWETNQKSEAINFLHNALLSKKDSLLFTTLAEYYVKSGDHKNAINILHKGYLEYPNDTSILAQFAKSAYELGQNDICVLLYKDLLNINTNSSNYWSLLGNSYLKLELYNLSLIAYEKAADLSKHKEGWIYDNIGNLYYAKKLYDKAEANLKIALTLNDKSDYTHSRLASVYTGNQEESKKVEELLSTAKSKLSLDILMP